jgi:hypothetical protein
LIERLVAKEEQERLRLGAHGVYDEYVLDATAR